MRTKTTRKRGTVSGRTAGIFPCLLGLTMMCAFSPSQADATLFTLSLDAIVTENSFPASGDSGLFQMSTLSIGDPFKVVLWLDTDVDFFFGGDGTAPQVPPFFDGPILGFDVFDGANNLVGGDGAVSSELTKAGSLFYGYTLSGPETLDLDFDFDATTLTGTIALYGQNDLDGQLLRGEISNARLSVPESTGTLSLLVIGVAGTVIAGRRRRRPQSRNLD